MTPTVLLALTILRRAVQPLPEFPRRGVFDDERAEIFSDMLALVAADAAQEQLSGEDFDEALRNCREHFRFCAAARRLEEQTR